VQDQGLVGVHLHVAQQRHFGHTADFQVEHGGMEGLLAQRMVQRVVVQLDGERFLAAAVHDARHKAGVTQAAARTRALHVTLLGDNFDFHFSLPQITPATRSRKR
jgi:hypothetical protein